MTNPSTMESTIRIHIDEKQYESPNPTTGEALYLLGNVPAGLELYREVTGDREDPPVTRGPEEVHLKEDAHFHSGPPRRKEYTVIVNGRKKVVQTSTLSYDQVVALAFDPVPVGPNVLFSVTFSHGPHENREGTLTQGETVQIKNEMIFNVSQTDKS